MLITWATYRAQLPEALHEKFRELANRRPERAIIYADGILRYAAVDEY